MRGGDEALPNYFKVSCLNVVDVLLVYLALYTSFLQLLASAFSDQNAPEYGILDF